MEIGMIRKVDIDQEMQQSYLDYAMSTIVARALPDARDGLKPVQRRVLYAMYDMGLLPGSAYKKSARIVGEALGKYHPHGDMAIYEAMARLAQDFTMRHTLVDGQGNFGSVDGDPPAAMRYTEARLGAFAIQLLDQLDRNTVDFVPNFDGTLTEPVVLPAAVPNLLVNGSTGIAVGMATNIPPHNLAEVIDALVYLLREWEKMDDISISDLMKFIKGPDFPTGGLILQEEGQNELLAAYATGRGRVKLRGKAQMEEMARGRSRLIITELPYQVNKSALIERIAELVREGVLEGIADLRDESDRQGMRIVIEFSKAAQEENTLRELYRRTPLETTFGITLLALVDGEPRLLTLKQALRVFLEHRLVVIKRRAEYDLAKAKQRAHILEGLRIALQNLDEIIALIRNSPDVETAKERLIRRYKLSEIQAQAILDMPLRRLAALERRKIEQEYRDLQAQIKELEGLLRSPKKMRQVAEEELITIRQKFADRRKTQVVSLAQGKTVVEVLTSHALAPAQEVWVGITEDGQIARTMGDAAPRLSGRTAPILLLNTNSHHTLYLVGEDGRTAAVPVEGIPEVEKVAEGVHISRAAPFAEGEQVAALFSLPPHEQIQGEHYVMTVSRMGMVKKTSIEELPGPSAQRFVLAKVNPGDSLEWAFLTNGNAEILLLTAQGMAIRFSETEVRPMGLVAAGVNGIKLLDMDQVVKAEVLNPGDEVLVLSTNGRGLRLSADEFPVQGRYGQGVGTCRLDPGSRMAGMMVGKRTNTGTVFFKKSAAQSVRLDVIPMGKRLRMGQVAVNVKPGDAIVALSEAVDSLTFWEGKRGRQPRRVVEVKPPEPMQQELFQTEDLSKAPVKKRTKRAVSEKPVVKSVEGSAPKTNREKRQTLPKTKATRTKSTSASVTPEKPERQRITPKTATTDIPPKTAVRPKVQRRTGETHTAGTGKQPRPANRRKAAPKSPATTRKKRGAKTG